MKKTKALFSPHIQYTCSTKYKFGAGFEADSMESVMVLDSKPFQSRTIVSNTQVIDNDHAHNATCRMPLITHYIFI